MVYRELLIGCGHRRDKVLKTPANPDFKNLTTLDNNPACKPDIFWDLNKRPLPFDDNTFAEIHAYDVLEHIGRQGDIQAFFEEFYEYWRILTPGGLLCATVPWWENEWAWGDPGHTRVITHGTLIFLDQEQYTQQIGKTPMSDYRYLWRGNFKTIFANKNNNILAFVLEAIK